MTSDEWHNVMTLLTVVILADKRVYKEEVDTFVSTVKSLNETIAPGMFVTESMAFEWFKSNRMRVSHLLVGPHVERNIQDLVRSTSKISGKKAIIIAMEKIANADSDYHRNEDKIISKCVKGWKLAA